jgi:hypothetical protein
MKADIVGFGIYAVNQLDNLKSKFYNNHPGSRFIDEFGNRKKIPKFDFDFDDWSVSRAADGFLCRDHIDCQWVYRLQSL